MNAALLNSMSNPLQSDCSRMPPLTQRDAGTFSTEEDKRHEAMAIKGEVARLRMQGLTMEKALAAAAGKFIPGHVEGVRMFPSHPSHIH